MSEDLGEAHGSALHELDDAIHSLAQPMTAMVFAVEMAYLHAPTEQVRESLVAARTESRRAMEMVEKVRESARRVREEAVACGRT